MKRWKTEMVTAFENCDKERIIGLLRLGFPVESPLCLVNSNGDILIGSIYCVHLACSYGLIDVLREIVEIGGKLETKDSFKRTPLMISCEMGYLDIVKFLIYECKASVAGYNHEGLNALHIASINGRLEIVRFLIEDIGMSFKSLSKQKLTALSICKEVYMKSFDKSLEKVIVYLNSIRSFKEPNIFLDPQHGNFSSGLLNCHEKCKDEYLVLSSPIDLLKNHRSPLPNPSPPYKSSVTSSSHSSLPRSFNLKPLISSTSPKSKEIIFLTPKPKLTHY